VEQRREGESTKRGRGLSSGKDDGHRGVVQQRGNGGLDRLAPGWPCHFPEGCGPRCTGVESSSRVETGRQGWIWPYGPIPLWVSTCLDPRLVACLEPSAMVVVLLVTGSRTPDLASEGVSVSPLIPSVLKEFAASLYLRID
jgi:hypothetical protein